MNKYLTRAVVSLLIPCLLAGAVTPGAAQTRLSSPFLINRSSLFDQQALSAFSEWFGARKLDPSDWFAKRLVGPGSSRRQGWEIPGKVYVPPANNTMTLSQKFRLALPIIASIVAYACGGGGSNGGGTAPSPTPMTTTIQGNVNAGNQDIQPFTLGQNSTVEVSYTASNAPGPLEVSLGAKDVNGNFVVLPGNNGQPLQAVVSPSPNDIFGPGTIPQGTWYTRVRDVNNVITPGASASYTITLLITKLTAQIMDFFKPILPQRPGLLARDA